MRHVIKIILLLVNLLCCGLLLFGAYSGLYPTRIGVLIELIFPFSLLGCMICAVIWLIYKAKYALISTITLILSWGGIARYTPIHTPSDIDNTQPGFTLMSYNAYSFLDFGGEKPEQNRTVDFILSQNADVICLQEVLPIKPNKHLRITQKQIDSLSTRYPYCIFDKQVSLLSKYPARLISHINYTSTSVVSIYQIEIEGHPITVINQHLESIGLTKTDKELYQKVTEIPNTDQLDDIKVHLLSKLMNAAEIRNQQVDQIAEKIAQLPGPLIICGDFNDSPLSYSVRRFQRMGFHDVYSQLGLGPGITYHANRFWFRIDHILYRGNIEATGLERPRFKGSDHYPLITRFSWINPKNSSTQ